MKAEAGMRRALAFCHFIFCLLSFSAFIGWIIFGFYPIFHLTINPQTLPTCGVEYKNHRPMRLTQCWTQFRSLGVKVLCVFHLHDNIAFTFKWYGNTWNKSFYSQRIWNGYNIELGPVHTKTIVNANDSKRKLFMRLGLPSTRRRWKHSP